LCLCQGRAGHLLSGSANQFLGLGHTSSSISLDTFVSFARVLAGEIFDLVGLCTEDARRVVELFIDEFLVADVDQWRKEEDADAEQSQTPHREKFDEGRKGRRTQMRQW